MAAAERTVLITAATGHIGQEIVPQLLATSTKLVLSTSHAGRLKSNIPADAAASSADIAIEEGSFPVHNGSSPFSPNTMSTPSSSA